jgi:hypothetical protein
MHDAYMVGIPVLAILIGVLFNKHDVSVLRDEMRAGFANIREQMRVDFSDVKGQMQHLIDLHISHESRISKIEERTK